ncbi:phosphoenolpyruvate synthase [Pedobacter sp. KBS0701]|uniref:phosphoenolpyruvate synthase n=2 Tax=unclassified Pedobacter TaxID=2628915 RepID=UPI00110DD646|nr:phosphoenolpyruvate synthase [Pedobacter sp. KBS0701]QDW26825.1 phosphoenolpyruvate synthase [Pedobacter sp. KBS0701]
MSTYAIGFQEIDRSDISGVGSKGANLGELSRIEGIQVPDGFCITTKAYKKITANNEQLTDLLDELSQFKTVDLESVGITSAEIRKLIENVCIPDDVTEEIESYLINFNEQEAFAIRSSSTAEDLPMASSAGQLDTYLNIIGKTNVLKHISKCWASLFTDRAVIYRIQNGFDHRKVQLSVVVQKMVFPQAAGILFTADPVSGNRKILSIDASFGLGETLVSGLVNADHYQVCNGRIIHKKISAKKLAIYALKDGGTESQALSAEVQNKQVLTDEQILQLEQLGRKIEEHFGQPQDIEWCLFNDTFYMVQSRPITTLYPIPETNDAENRVFISVGHQQMMTDAMKPLGLSLWQLRAARPMFGAGGRLFVDVTDNLATPVGRESLLDAMSQHDPLIKDALINITERGDFIKPLPDDGNGPVLVKSTKGLSAAAILAQIGNDPTIVADLIKHNQTSVETLKRNIQTKSGPALFDFILEDIEQSKKMIFDSQHMGVIIAAMNASSWLNEKMEEWLGEKNPADILSQSAPNNITSEMGLALLDVADIIRPYPEVIDYLQEAKEDDFLDKLIQFDGGEEAQEAIYAYLGKYGMRCAGEIDITNTRWSEKPLILIPLILSNIKNFEPNASKRKFEQGQQEALKKENELLDKLALLREGEQKVRETKQMISLLRNFAGYREYPKYGIVNRFFIYKQALMKEGEQLLKAEVINEREDIYYLTFHELHEAVSANKLDIQLVNKRKEVFKRDEKLIPPRVITSNGEIIRGKYKRENLPDEAIIGLAVSSGVIEGRARVILNMKDANLEDGDILVTPFTDPSWTPLFVSIKGLITEVGGLMTHGAVIAREYGLPAVVGVENATKLIKDGQRIRVNGTDGYVEILESW